MRKRTWLLTGLALLLVAAAIVPAAAAITRFTDVPDTNIFAEDIKWMDDNGITTGCGTDLYCPSANVTREQMSAFMHRLATRQVVDAKTLEGKGAAAFATAGHDHDTDYLARTGTAADSELVGGMAPSDLIRVAYWSSSDPLPNDYAQIDSFNITAPTSGFLMLSSSLQLNTANSTENIYCAFELNDELVSTSATTEWASYPTPGFNAGCHAEAVVPVKAGTHKITVMGFYHDLLESQFEWANASALFVPFDGSGSAMADIAMVPAGPNEYPDSVRN